MSPERHTFAVELLAPRTGDRLLEIGCGRGITASLLLAQPGVHYVGIDRSAVMLAAAKRRNRGAVSHFHIMALATADLGGERFDKIVAVNVNVFWLKPARELAAIRRLLASDGTLLLVYTPPDPSQVAGAIARLEANFAAGGLIITRIEQRAGLLGVMAAPDGGRPRP